MLNKSSHIMTFLLAFNFFHCSNPIQNTYLEKNSDTALFLLGFHKEDPYTFFMPLQIDSIRSIAQGTKSFYTNDLGLIQEFKNKLFIKKARKKGYECNYNALFIISKKDTVISQILYSYIDKQIKWNDVPYEFDSVYFDALCSKMKPLEHFIFSFKSLKYGREYYKKMNDSAIYLKLFKKDESDMNWLIYEGEFWFRYPYKNYRDYHQIIAEAELKIRSIYKTQSFLLDYIGSQPYDKDKFHLMKIECNKSFYDQFNLYPKFEWIPYDIGFSVYKIKN